MRFNPHGGFGEVPLTPPAQQQYYEEPAALTFDVTLTANQNLPSQALNLDSDGDFVLKALCGSQTGAYSVRFRLPNGRYFPSTYTRNGNIIGTAQFPVPVEPHAVFPAGSQIILDLIDLSGSSNTIQIVFYGAKLLQTR